MVGGVHSTRSQFVRAAINKYLDMELKDAINRAKEFEVIGSDATDILNKIAVENYKKTLQ